MMQPTQKTTSLAVLLSLLAVAGVLAQSFEIDWYTIDGGGDMFTTGGAFELSGTIGQPDANTAVMTGDDLELVGGFWPGTGVEPVYPLGDLNCDGRVDAEDIDPFVLALTSAPGFEEYYAAYPDCDPMLADINEDGEVNGFDIDPFVALLIGG